MSRLQHLVLVLGLSALTLDASQARDAPGLKLFISADMEGIAGLVDSTQISREGSDYSVGRRLMTAEVNAGIVAAFQAGATEIAVTDGHGKGTNLLVEELDPRVTLVTGTKPLDMMQGIDRSFDAVLFIGYHARGSTAEGVLAHTYNSKFLGVKLNERDVGEYGLNAAIAGHFDVPVIFISGDRAVTEQAKSLVPEIEAAVVKEGYASNAASSVSPAEARRRIASGVTRALERRKQIAVFRLTPPIKLEIELYRSVEADDAMLIPGMKRLAARTISYSASDMLVAYRMSILIDRLVSK